MEVSPAIHRQLKSFFNSLNRTSARHKASKVTIMKALRQRYAGFIASHPNPSAFKALVVLGLLNIPPFLCVLASITAVTVKAMKDFPKSRRYRYIVRFLPSTKDSQLQYHLASRVKEARENLWFLRNFTLSLDRFRKGSAWTLVTSAFTHLEPSHLIANMTGLYVFGDLVTQVKTVRLWDVYSIALGSAVTSGLAFLWQQSTLPPFVRGDAFGASGIVCAFAVIAALLNPYAKLSISAGLLPMPVPCWLAVSIMVLGDLALLNEGSRRAVGGGVKQEVGHAAHLGGAAFGVVYYFLFLRGMQARDFGLGDGRSDVNDDRWL